VRVGREQRVFKSEGRAYRLKPAQMISHGGVQVLETNGGAMEPTVEQLLVMEGDTG